MSARLVAVLGYSDGARGELHAICAERLRKAELEAGPEDIVLLSGWARGRDARSEAELMARSWNGRAGRVVLDRRARTTYGNVCGVAELARRSGVQEVVLVTSDWHAGRAGGLLRLALRGSGAKVRIVSTEERCSISARMRELAGWAAAPLVALEARKR
jgi:DUF218 domain